MKMTIEDITLNITTNKLNKKSFWNPYGMFCNLVSVERDGTWYDCGVNFTEKEGKSYMQVQNLKILDDRNTILHIEHGIYKEVAVSAFEKNLIQILLNSHSLNYKWFDFRKRTYKRRNTILVFAASISMGLVYYFGNEYYNGAWQTYIANNSFLQALFILLNIFTFGSVFFPFTIRKELSETDIRKLFEEEIERHEKEKEQMEKNRKRASF